MDIRKVQKVSAGTFVISLPKKWAVAHHVKAGTVLSVSEQPSGDLLVSPHAERAAPKVPHLHDPETLEQSISACYILGAKAIIIDNLTPEIRVRTLTKLQQLPGLEVAHETAQTMTIHCLLDEATVQLSTLLDRLCVLLRHGVQLAGNDVAVRQNELEVNRAYHLAHRILTRASSDPAFLQRAGVPSTRAIPTLQLLVKRLERIGDEIKSLPATQRRDAGAIVDLVCGMVNSFTAGKHGKLPSRETILALKKGKSGELATLVKMADGLREELVLLRVAEQF